MSRVYHHYESLEEYRDGMWRIAKGAERAEFIASAANLMRDGQRFGGAMMCALEEWPLSCEHNLTAENINRVAWLGHAGCCVAVRSPEECTRLGWHTLNQSEQDEANRIAGEVLAAWDDAQRQDLFSWSAASA